MNESRRRLVQILAALLCVVFIGLALGARRSSLLPAITEASGLKSALFRNPQSAFGNDLPDGPGVEVVNKSCLECHKAGIIAEQRLSWAAWNREVDKMIRWGAEVEPGEKDRLTGYLSASFSARAKPGLPPDFIEDSGVEIARHSCSECHKQELIVQQRLSRTAWTREVDKMIRWGAEMKSGEREALIEYLARNYPPLNP